MVSPARWAAVVVNYEAGELLARCVASVCADTSAGAVELVVVDNGSRDGSIDLLRTLHPGAHVVRAPGNVGYARAANLGVAATRAPFVAVLNPDTEVVPGTAAAMLARFESDPRVGACGPRIRNTDGSDYPSARVVPSVADAVGHGVLGLFWARNPFTRRYRQLDADANAPRTTEWISGAAIWLRRAALDDIGGWDERYFMYLEDVDLGYRMRGAGWSVAYEPAGTVVHVQGVSTSRHPYRMMVEHHRSALRFVRLRLSGVKVLLVPFAATYLALRALLAMATHALRTRRVRSA